jgi:hypothetical protein
MVYSIFSIEKLDATIFGAASFAVGHTMVPAVFFTVATSVEALGIPFWSRAYTLTEMVAPTLSESLGSKEQLGNAKVSFAVLIVSI